MGLMTINSGNMLLDKKLYDYLDHGRGLSTTKVIEDMILQGRYQELESRVMKRLAFGTAGLRGKMEAGYNAMNDLVIIQTSQGLAAYIDSNCFNESRKSKGVAIGYDNRHNSRRFAELAAVSFILRGIKVYLFSSIVPTPFVPYAVRRLKCLAGIVITASHNPKDENGYKVYWENGAQILSPIDKDIENCILTNLQPWPLATRTSLVWSSPLCHDPLSEIECGYYDDLNVDSFKEISDGKKNPISITFTSLHGVAHRYMKKAFQKCDYHNYIAVEEQMMPDPEFPTVYFPNPEEKNCMNLSIATANKYNSPLIVANDPDADRLAVAEKMENGEWHIFTGNQIGGLLGSWIWKNFPAEKKKIPETCFMISSAVSSKILRSIAAKEGFQFCETLTGFKWMANRADFLISQGLHFLLAFEEAIGYMCNPHVLDKDGIQAALHVSKMACLAYKEGKTLKQLLKELYLKYGYHTSNNSYFLSYKEENMNKMFTALRKVDKNVFEGVPDKNNYPKTLKSKNHTFEVTEVRDLTIGYDSAQPKYITTLPPSKSTQMITFYFSNGCELTIRGSGTEPKLKYYAEMIAEVPEEQWKNVDATLQELVDAMIIEWIKPEEHGFLPRPS